MEKSKHINTPYHHYTSISFLIINHDKNHGYFVIYLPTEETDLVSELQLSVFPFFVLFWQNLDIFILKK